MFVCVRSLVLPFRWGKWFASLFCMFSPTLGQHQQRLAGLSGKLKNTSTCIPTNTSPFHPRPTCRDTTVHQTQDQGEHKVGYARLRDFNSIVANSLRDALVEMKKEGADEFVLDLRGNGGGAFQSALGVAGLFMDSKPITYVVSLVVVGRLAGWLPRCVKRDLWLCILYVCFVVGLVPFFVFFFFFRARTAEYFHRIHRLLLWQRNSALRTQRVYHDHITAGSPGGPVVSA